jgi:uncharacterized Zn-binding protein involved in type VI secretion
MPFAARVGDPSAHGGTLTPLNAAVTVLICGMPAAVVGTMHACPVPPPAGPHPPSPVLPPGCPTVLIEKRPAARMGDMIGCGASIVMGCPTVRIGG